MFTGIVREVGVIRGRARRGDAVLFSVASGIVSHAGLGDSIAVDGVCLTVVEKDGSGGFFEAVRNTIDSTTLKRLKKEDRVNIEPSLKAGDSLGGHYVSGHVDCVGRIRRIAAAQESAVMEIGIASRDLDGLAVEKGSIAIDGVSLTISGINVQGITIHVIPHTMRETTLGLKKSGDEVNVEFDMLGKYVSRRDKAPGQNVITEEYLKGKGFI